MIVGVEESVERSGAGVVRPVGPDVGPFLEQVEFPPLSRQRGWNSRRSECAVDAEDPPQRLGTVGPRG